MTVLFKLALKDNGPVSSTLLMFQDCTFGLKSTFFHIPAIKDDLTINSQEQFVNNDKKTQKKTPQKNKPVNPVHNVDGYHGIVDEAWFCIL